jgi:putrescine aminotransferase
MVAMHAQGGMPIPDITHINQPHWYAEGGDMTPEEFGLARARELEETIDRLGEDRVAAFIAEPIQGAGGVIIPPETYWPEIQRICDEREILLIADEVICGFGRTGNWFGSQTYGIRPDIMTIAKGLSSGYAPIGGSIVSDKVADVIATTEFAHGYTYSGHPVACAVALENLRIMEEEKIVERGAVAARHLARIWAERFTDHPLVGDVSTKGMLGAIQLTPRKGSRAPFAAEKGTVGTITRDACFANDVVMRHVGDRMIVSPPLVMTEEEIEELANRATKALDIAYAACKEQGLLVPAS